MPTMNLSDFINKYRGVKGVGNTPENKGECVGLVSVWMDTMDIPHVWGHARDLFANATTEHFTKIKNAPGIYPQEGDIVTWDKTHGGGFGHTGIVVSSNPETDSFLCFEQNNPLGSPPTIIGHTNWNGLIGWLRPKAYTPPTTCEEEIRQLEIKLKAADKRGDEWKEKCIKERADHKKTQSALATCKTIAESFELKYNDTKTLYGGEKARREILEKRVEGLEDVFIPSLQDEIVELNATIDRLKLTKYTVPEAAVFLYTAIKNRRWKPDEKSDSDSNEST